MASTSESNSHSPRRPAQVGTIKLAISTPYDEIVRNTRTLARTAVETGMPLVLTTSQEDHFKRLLLAEVQRLARKPTRSE